MSYAKYFLLTFGIVLGVVSAHAADSLCNYFDESGICRDANRSIIHMRHYEASGTQPSTGEKVTLDACEAAGKGHLPTIREFAMESQAKGAKGILEISQVDPNHIPAGYDKITSINANDKEDEFYFNHDGYKQPAGDLGNNWFWSASVFGNETSFAYILNGESGSLKIGYRNDHIHDDMHGYVVRCIGAAKAHAETPCDHWDQNKICRGTDGSIKPLNQDEARKACPTGTHLPHIRELAKEAQAHGAKGILEMDQVKPGGIPAGYQYVSRFSQGSQDEFYYSAEGYRRPAGDLGDVAFWSSSTNCPDNSEGYYLDGTSGSIGRMLFVYHVPVRCVSDL